MRAWVQIQLKAEFNLRLYNASLRLAFHDHPLSTQHDLDNVERCKALNHHLNMIQVSLGKQQKFSSLFDQLSLISHLHCHKHYIHTSWLMYHQVNLLVSIEIIFLISLL